MPRSPVIKPSPVVTAINPHAPNTERYPIVSHPALPRLTQSRAGCFASWAEPLSMLDITREGMISACRTSHNSRVSTYLLSIPRAAPRRFSVRFMPCPICLPREIYAGSARVVGGSEAFSRWWDLSGRTATRWCCGLGR